MGNIIFNQLLNDGTTTDAAFKNQNCRKRHKTKTAQTPSGGESVQRKTKDNYVRKSKTLKTGNNVVKD